MIFASRCIWYLFYVSSCKKMSWNASLLSSSHRRSNLEWNCKKNWGRFCWSLKMLICFAIIRDELTQQRDNLQLELAEIKVKVSRKNNSICTVTLNLRYTLLNWYRKIWFSMHQVADKVGKMLKTKKKDSWARICKLLRSSRIDSKISVLPARVG